MTQKFSAWQPYFHMGFACALVGGGVGGWLDGSQTGILTGGAVGLVGVFSLLFLGRAMVAGLCYLARTMGRKG